MAKVLLDSALDECGLCRRNYCREAMRRDNEKEYRHGHDCSDNDKRFPEWFKIFFKCSRICYFCSNSIEAHLCEFFSVKYPRELPDLKEENEMNKMALLTYWKDVCISYQLYHDVYKLKYRGQKGYGLENKLPVFGAMK